MTLHQYPDVTVTVTTSSSQTGPELEVTGADITKTNRANGSGAGIVTYTLAVNEDAETAGFFYVNKGSFNKALTASTMLKKVVSRTEGEFSRINNLILKPLTTRTVNGDISGELTPGMKIYGKIEKTKIVTESLEVPTCRRKTNKFSLSDTVGLFPGMTINIPGEPLAELVSVDCAKNITINRKVVILENREIVFKYETWSSINEVTSQINSEGETCIKTFTDISAVNGMELEFDDNTSRISGSFRFSGSGSDASGSDTVTLISDVDISKFGLQDVTYTWNLDDFISRNPNARDHAVDVAKNAASGVIVNMQNNDYDSNAATKTQVITKQPSNGVASTSGRNITYNPHNGFVGSDEILFTVSDGRTSSAEKRITITVK